MEEKVIKRQIAKPEQQEEILHTAISDAMSESEETFLNYVNTQIMKMEQKLVFDGSSTPSLFQIDSEIAKHAHVLLALTSLYEQARWNYNKAKESYTEWYSEKFLETRIKLNTADLARNKWYSKDEIDCFIIQQFKKERAKFLTEIQIADAKKSMLSRLIEGWQSYGFQLHQMSKNGIAEMDASRSEKYME